jgi:hypothetical protein
VKTESVRYDADGLQMIGHFTYDENDSRKSNQACWLFPGRSVSAITPKRAERIAAELGIAAMARHFVRPDR